MDENFTQSAACSGECSTCGSDCGIDVSQPTVTLTLDDDTEVVCAVLTSRHPTEMSISRFFRWTRTARTRTEKSISTATLKPRKDSLLSQTLKKTKNTTLLPTHSTRCWTACSSTEKTKKKVDPAQSVRYQRRKKSVPGSGGSAPILRHFSFYCSTATDSAYSF